MESGVRQLCLDRKFALLTHFSAADQQTVSQFTSDLKLLHDRANNSSATASSAELAAVGLDDTCKKSVGDLTQVDSSGQAGHPDSSTVAGGAAVIQNAVAPDLGGWDVDVYYCGPANGQDAQVAKSFASALAASADARQPISGERIGRVRLGPGRGTSQNWVIYDPPEKAFAQKLVQFVSGVNHAEFQAVPNGGAVTPWYVSVFTCGTVPK